MKSKDICPIGPLTPHVFCGLLPQQRKLSCSKIPPGHDVNSQWQMVDGLTKKTKPLFP